MWRKLCGIPYFLHNAVRYRRLNKGSAFTIRLRHLHYASYDRFSPAGNARTHYFHQDLWAARLLAQRQVRELVDVGSRLDGFIAHVLPFCRVCYVDLRSLNAAVPGLEYRQGSALQLPFADGSVAVLTCLHVIEHIGLGRYGDPIHPEGHLAAAKELARVLAPGGILLLGTPVGRERLCFDAHRVFNPQTIVDAFPTLSLEEFSLVDDQARGVQHHATFEAAQQCNYGCGLFVFTTVPAGAAGRPCRAG